MYFFRKKRSKKSTASMSDVNNPSTDVPFVNQNLEVPEGFDLETIRELGANPSLNIILRADIKSITALGFAEQIFQASHPLLKPHSNRFVKTATVRHFHLNGQPEIKVGIQLTNPLSTADGTSHVAIVIVTDADQLSSLLEIKTPEKQLYLFVNMDVSAIRDHLSEHDNPNHNVRLVDASMIEDDGFIQEMLQEALMLFGNAPTKFNSPDIKSARK